LDAEILRVIDEQAGEVALRFDEKRMICGIVQRL
jgi:hypothetical protein